MQRTNKLGLYPSFVRYISCPLIFEREGLHGLFPALRDLEKSQFFSLDQLRELQFARLKKLLTHAFRNTDFYRRRFDEAGFAPETMHDFDELHQIPTLSKQEIRENVSSMIARTCRPQDLHAAETGGTTGVKMKFYRDNACLYAKEAALYRFEKWGGWDFGQRVGIVWPAQQDYIGSWTWKGRIKNALSYRRVVFPAAVMDERAISDYVHMLMRTKPSMIRAFTSPICEVARHIRERLIDSITLKGVITTGEPLYPHQRKLISEAFHCAVYDSYRSRETGPLAQECQAHHGMHINAESLYVETIPLEDPASVDPDAREIVVTDLLNYGMPLVRYRMNDLGALSSSTCQCGRGLPILQRIVGRAGDILYTQDMKRVPAGAAVLYLVDEAPALMGQVQIIQESLHHLTIRMTRNPPPCQELLEYEKNTVKRLFGEKMQVTFTLVDQIPREASGKYRFTICNIPGRDL